MRTYLGSYNELITNVRKLLAMNTADLPNRNDSKNPEEIVLEGVSLSYGAVVGRARFYKIPQQEHDVSKTSQDTEEERQKIKAGLRRLRESMSEILAETAIILTEESVEIFDVYRLLVQDPMFEKELLQRVEAGDSAFEATEWVAQKFRRKMRQDTFWKSRLYDLQYLLRRLRHFLSDDPQEDEPEKAVFNSQPIILIAPYISPADLLHAYRFQHVVGLVLKDASPTSHTSIVARSLHVPTLGSVFLPQSICPFGTHLLIDANASKLYVHPSSETLQRMQKKTIISYRQKESLPIQTVTKDNVKINLFLNANLTSDFDLLQHPVIHGVGLFRTEILLMSPEVATDFYAQVEEYKKIFDLADNKPVIFRTIDMSDDKEAESFVQEDVAIKQLPESQRAPLKDASNVQRHLILETSMGKILLNRHEFLRTQIRALLRARIGSTHPHNPVYIMVPMIADVVELKAYQKIIESESLRESKHCASIASQIKLGVMVEVPSLVYQIPRFQSLVDFVSIGTNDLFQYFFATNRWAPQTRRSQDVLAPTFLKFIGQIVHQFQQHGIPVHVCGEMATHPITAMALLGLGVRQLSVAPSAVYQIANMISSLPLGLLYPYLRTFRVESFEFSISTQDQYNSSTDVRHTLQQFAHSFGVAI